MTDTTTSAVERLADDLDGLMPKTRNRTKAAATLRALAAERDRLREALALFADDESWKRDRACDPNSACFVGQAVARAALDDTNE